MLTNECWFFVGHITGRHDTHRTLSACPLYHNMSVEDCKVIENCTGVMNSVYSSYLKRQEWCTYAGLHIGQHIFSICLCPLPIFQPCSMMSLGTANRPWQSPWSFAFYFLIRVDPFWQPAHRLVGDTMLVHVNHMPHPFWSSLSYAENIPRKKWLKWTGIVFCVFAIIEYWGWSEVMQRLLLCRST